MFRGIKTGSVSLGADSAGSSTEGLDVLPAWHIWAVT